jgi:hypothetical protein
MKQMFNSLAAVIANPLATTAGMVGVAVAIVAGNAFAQTATYPVMPVREPA